MWLCFASVKTRAGMLLVIVAVSGGPTAALALRQSVVDVSIFRDMAWRPLGPFRGGRTTVAVGVPSQPNTFFAGTANGGVWKTTDAGRAWRPIFDRETTGAVGSIAVAASNPGVIYVGTGEAPLDRHAARGQGLYKSADGGASWTLMGLADHAASLGGHRGPIQPRAPVRGLDRQRVRTGPRPWRLSVNERRAVLRTGVLQRSGHWRAGPRFRSRPTHRLCTPRCFSHDNPPGLANRRPDLAPASSSPPMVARPGDRLTADCPPFPITDCVASGLPSRRRTAPGCSRWSPRTLAAASIAPTMPARPGRWLMRNQQRPRRTTTARPSRSIPRILMSCI